MKKLVKILETILLVIVALISIKSIWSFIDVQTGYKCPFFGIREVKIVSNSMAYVDDSNKDRLEGITNQFKKNDVVCTNTYFSYESLQVNDVITFKKPDSSLIIHRIVTKMEKEGVKGFITQGDANNTSDGFIPYEYVNGKMYAIIPGFGTVVDFFQTGYGMVALFSVMAFIAIGMFIYDYVEYGKYKKLDKGFNKKYSEDKIIVLDPDQYSSSKIKKDYALVGANSNYCLENVKKEVVFKRYIVTSYNSKIENKIYDGEFKGKDLLDSIYDTLCPIVEKKILKGKNGVKYCAKTLKNKGITLSKEDIENLNNRYFETAKSSGLVKAEEGLKLTPSVKTSYEKTKEYLTKIGVNSFENLTYIYTYISNKSKSSNPSGGGK